MVFFLLPILGGIGHRGALRERGREVEMRQRIQIHSAMLSVRLGKKSLSFSLFLIYLFFFFFLHCVKAVMQFHHKISRMIGPKGG